MSLVEDVATRFRAIPRILFGSKPEPPRATEIEQRIDEMRSRLHSEVRRTGGNVPRAWERSLNEMHADLMARNDAEDRRVRYTGRSQGRVDTFSNFGTGIGVRGMDKRVGRGRWGYQDIPEFEARFILRGSDMAQRAVGKVVDEMFREGYRIRIPDNKDLATEQELANREMGLQDALVNALKWARAYGGCGLFLGADDGTKDLSLPLREDRIRTFDFVQPFTPLEMVPVTWYADPLRPKFGQPATYRLTPLDRPPGWSPDQFALPVIHESRVIAFQGTINWRGQIIYNIHPGWGDSVFVAIKQVLEDFEQAFGGTAILMADFAVATLKLKNLVEAMAADGAGLTNRAQQLEDGRSIARVTIIDSQEEFKRESTTVTGLPELIDRFEGRLASAMDLPVDLMLGQAPAGLNATGDSTIRWWYGTVSSMQMQKVRPPLERILKLRFLAKNGCAKGKLPKVWSVYFPTLWRPSEVEQAAIRFQQAQTDQIYLQNQVVTVKEIAKSRFGGEEYSTDTQLDMALREELSGPDEEAIELGLKDDPDAPPAHENQPAVAGALVAPGSKAGPAAVPAVAPVAEATSSLPKGKGKNQGFATKTKTSGGEMWVPGMPTKTGTKIVAPAKPIGAQSSSSDYPNRTKKKK